MCEMCDGPLMVLGQLGRRWWMRCRNCGWEVRMSKDFDPEIDESLVTC